MDTCLKFIAGLSRFLGVVAALLLVIAVIIVCQMVFSRFVLGFNTSWQTEFITYALLASTFLGAPWVLLTQGHVSINLIPLLFAAKGRFIFALIAYSLGTILCLVIAWQSIFFWHEAWENGWSSDSIWGPKLWKAYLPMPIGFLAISLQYLAQLICLITGREPPFGIVENE